MTLQIGILGAAGIAPAAIILPAARNPGTAIAAVAARDRDRAEAYARRHGIPRWYGSYEELLSDPAIDLVYVALPPSEHAPWSIAALEAGKHVLCEKPFALNADEARRMVEAAERAGRRLIEAFHDRYHPLWDATVELAGRLGPLTSIEGEFVAVNAYEAGTLRHEPALGGGALMDLGCYPVHWLRALAGEEPTVTAAHGVANPSGADSSMTAEFLFPSGTVGRVVCEMGDTNGNVLRFEGANGRAEIVNPVFAAHGHSIRSWIDGVPRSETVAGQETYDHQLRAVELALVSGAPLPTEGHDPIGNMTTIDAIYAAAGFTR